MDGYSSDGYNSEEWMAVNPEADGFRFCQRYGCGRSMCHGQFVYTHCCKGCLNDGCCEFGCDVDYIRERIQKKYPLLAGTRLSVVNIRGGRDDLLVLYREREGKRRVGPIFRQWVQSVGTPEYGDRSEKAWHRLLGDIARERMVLVEMSIRWWVMMWKQNVFIRSKWQCLLAKARLGVAKARHRAACFAARLAHAPTA